METDFKLTYDPEKSENREIGFTMLDPKAMAKVAQAAQSAMMQFTTDPQKMFEFNSADDKGKEAMMESAKNSGYLVGPTVGGAFGSHHFNQFYPILKMKEKYNEIKAEGEALNGNGFANAVGGVVSVATGGLINAKTAAKFMNDNGDVIDTITTVAAIVAAPFTGGASLLALAAYKSVKGAFEGGVLGAATGFASGYASVTGIDVSYSYDEGFGANVGVKAGAVSLGMSYSESAGFGASASVKLGGFSAGVSYTQNGGFGANVGYEFGGNTDALKGLGLNLSYSQSGGFSGGVSYSKTTEGGTKVTGGLNYSKDTGVGASLNAQKEVSRNDNYATTVTGGVSFSQKQGFGASVDATIEKVAKATPPGQVAPPKFQSVSQLDMGLSFNQKEGFSASVGFDGINALSYNQNTGLSGNTNFAVDFRKKQIQDEIDAETKARKDAADQKLEAEKQEWLKEKRKDPKYANIEDDDKLLAEYKKDREKDSAQDGSRDSLLAKIGGDIYDDVAGALGISTSDAGRLDENGKFVPRTCFTAGTKIHTKDGLKNIEDIQVGDVVLSWNEKTGEREYKVVTELFLHEINQLYEVKTTKGTTLETTWNHPFWVVDKKAWVEVKDLQVGDVLALADGALVEISNIRSYDVEPTKVYNFEVEDNHSYFVGEDGVLVHNYVLSVLYQAAQGAVLLGFAICNSTSICNSQENKPPEQAPPGRMTDVSPIDADLMRKQGLNPSDRDDIDFFVGNKKKNETLKLKPLNEDNFRTNLKRWTGENPPSSIHAHHIIPKEFADVLKKDYDIDVNHPENGIWLDNKKHSELHSKESYNKNWATLLAQKPPKAEIYRIREYYRKKLGEK